MEIEDFFFFKCKKMVNFFQNEKNGPKNWAFLWWSEWKKKKSSEAYWVEWEIYSLSFRTSVCEYCWLIIWVSGCISEYKSLSFCLFTFLFLPPFLPLLSLFLLSRAGDEPSLQRCFIHNDTWPIWKSNNTVCTQYPGHSITRAVVVKNNSSHIATL